MRLYYTLKTLDPIIVSQNTATTNAHECLDYIPGSAILGALAANHYSGLTEKDSWSIFHNSEVCFGPCYPVTNGQLSMPTPASWHFPKGVSAVDTTTQKYNSSVITNHAAKLFKRDETTQYKQCRDGYLIADGTNAKIDKGFSTKTAIESNTGKAKDGQLFSYSYLESGQTFLGWIDCKVPELLSLFETSLNQTLRIGRSRNTEFGRVSLKLQPVAAQPTPQNLGNRLVIWCLSDCELLDENGLPTLNPSAKSIHSEIDGQLDRHRSFINLARISRFNQKRQGLDGEQLLIRKGSVLVYELNSKLNEQLLLDISSNGLGLNRQQGLGWVYLNPSWAAKSQIDNDALFEAIKVDLETDPVTIATPANSSLVGWIKEQVQGNNTATQNQKDVNNLLISICHAYKNARSYNNILLSNEAGPSSTQWRRIATEVRNLNDQWNKEVFYCEQPICKANNDELGWGIEWYGDKALLNFADFTKTKLADQSVATMRLLLEQLCRYDLSTFQGLKKLAKELKLDKGEQ